MLCPSNIITSICSLLWAIDLQTSYLIGKRSHWRHTGDSDAALPHTVCPPFDTPILLRKQQKIGLLQE